MTSPTPRSVRVLLVEDDPGDARLTIESLRRSKIRNNVTVLDDGAEVLPYLRREGEHAGTLRPDLVVLDLNLPGRNGLEILADIRADPALSTLPIVILTTSGAESDIAASYEGRANAFVTKPLDLHQFSSVVGAIEEFWFEVVAYPHGDDETS